MYTLWQLFDVRGMMLDQNLSNISYYSTSIL